MAKKANKQLEEQLINVLNSDSANELVVFLSKLSEEERLSLGKVTREWAAMRAVLFLSKNFRDAERENMVSIVQLAAIATLDIKTLGKGLGTDSVRFSVNSAEAALAILPFRNREFVNEYLLQIDKRWTLYWKCYQSGLCPRRIDEPAITSWLSHCDSPDWKTEDKNLSIVQIWEKYPELFELEFWYIFEHEFSKLYGFAYHDSHNYGNRSWTDAFLELVDRKHVQRERLLDATLGTLKFSYPDNEMRWYSNLHRKMQPSTEEAKEREEKYLDLLDNRNPSSVALGFEMLIQLDKAGQLDDRLFLQRVGPIFNEKPKSRSKTTVGILDRIAKRDKSLRNEAVSVALSALSHEAVDVQAAAAKLILQHIDSTANETVSQIQNMMPSLHGSVQAMLAKLADNTVTRSPSMPVAEIIPRRFGSLDVNRLESLPKLKPVETVDELIDLAAKVLATPSEIDEIELLYDGVSRLHQMRDDDFERKTSAIKKSLLSGKLFHNTYTDYLFGKYLGILVGSWFADSIDAQPDKRLVSMKFDDVNRTVKVSDKLHAETYFGQRLLDLAQRISNGAAVAPLSTPTHHGGWIDPKILVDRIKHDPHELKQHDTLDKVLSLYRIAPNHRDEALKFLGDHLYGDPYIDALRAVLGDETVTVTEPHYFIAVQARRQIMKHEPIFRVDLSANSISDMQLVMPDRVADKSLVPLYGIAAVFGLLPHYENTWVRAMLRWRGNLCPAIRDSFYWDSHSILRLEIDDMYDYPGPDAFLEPLCDPNEPVTEAAATSLLAALVVKPESVARLAEDILIASTGDGRLDAVTLSNAAAYWVRNNLPKRNRWIKRFQLAALQSPATQTSFESRWKISFRCSTPRKPPDSSNC